MVEKGRTKRYYYGREILNLYIWRKSSMSNVTNNPAIQRMNELLDEHSFVELGALVQIVI